MIGLVLALVGMVSISWLILSGARPRRGDTVLHARTFSFLSRYENRSLWPSLILGAFAVGTLVSADGIGAVSVTAGAFLGVGCALTWRLGFDSVVELGLGAIGLGASAVAIARLAGFVAPSNLEVVYAYALLALFTACFAGGLVLGHGIRSLSLRHGLVYFGMVDVLVFLTSPAGAPTWELSTTRWIVYVVIGCGVALALGLLGTGIVITLAAAGVTVTEVMFDLGSLGGRMSVLLAAVVVATVVRSVGGRRAGARR